MSTARTTRSGRLGHLIGRFFGHLTARGLTPDEQQLVHDRLEATGTAMFWSQALPDQRHAYDVAIRVASTLPGDDEAVVAALLHDVGKRASAPGAVRRSLATMFDRLGLPLTANMDRYRTHGPIGADDLAAAGFDGVVVAFARHHPGPAPDGFDETRWRALLEADG